ncbi:MAG: LysM peptidoglycan-binding domain-containing protein [Lewinellaceae bacterium]|nr:LysM peptidoglycan-binding domain-containing protein [Saprospiraceae bacterium]MCB9344235.1 LysM peptidoglycan-binding domain-containing protein [Lewinellaceae bacterium]
MAVKDKYASVLSLGEKLGVRDGKVEEGADGILRVWGRVSFNYEKDQLWDAIKAVGGQSPSDIVADIKVDNPSFYTKHTVVKGESLSKIAKHYYDDMMKYKLIFDANRDQLDNPDRIDVGQVLTIPNL